MVKGDNINEGIILATKYVKHMYLRPDLKKLVELLSESKITWIRHSKNEKELSVETYVMTLDEIIKKLEDGIFGNMSIIAVHNVEINPIDETNCEIRTKTTQHWKGDNHLPEDDYKIDSIIRIKFAMNNETNNFIITEVEHEYWNMTIILKEN